jgi:hypothetical protein
MSSSSSSTNAVKRSANDGPLPVVRRPRVGVSFPLFFFFFLIFFFFFRIFLYRTKKAKRVTMYRMRQRTKKAKRVYRLCPRRCSVRSFFFFFFFSFFFLAAHNGEAVSTTLHSDTPPSLESQIADVARKIEKLEGQMAVIEDEMTPLLKSSDPARYSVLDRRLLALQQEKTALQQEKTALQTKDAELVKQVTLRLAAGAPSALEEAFGFVSSLLRVSSNWNANCKFASESHSANDQQAAAKATLSKSADRAVSSSSRAAKLPYDVWDNPLGDIRTALSAAGVPVLPEFATLDVAALVACAVKLQEEEPEATGDVEVKFVHPVVRDVLVHFFEKLKLAMPGLGLDRVRLYVECRDNFKKTLARLPDAAFLTCHAAETDFDAIAQQSVVLPVEMKRSLDTTNSNDAVNAVQRDYVCTLSQPRELLPYGLGVVTDGRRYRLVRSELTPMIKSTWSRVFDFRVEKDAGEFLVLLAHALVLAAMRNYVYKFPLPAREFGVEAVAVRALLASSKNSVVFRFTQGRGAFVGKLFVSDDSNVASERLMCERAVWRQHGVLLSRCDNFVRRLPLLPWDHVRMIVYADTGAQPLREVRAALAARRVGEDEDKPCARLAQLKQVVASDVAAALKHLHSHGLAFFDLHPGQIVVELDASGDPVRARLVDVETIQPFETTVPSNRRVWCVEAFEPRCMSQRPVSAQTDAESFALTLDWLANGDDGLQRDKRSRLQSVNARFFDSLGLTTTRNELTKLKLQ